MDVFKSFFYRSQFFIHVADLSSWDLRLWRWWWWQWCVFYDAVAFITYRWIYLNIKLPWFLDNWSTWGEDEQRSDWSNLFPNLSFCVTQERNSLILAIYPLLPIKLNMMGKLYSYPTPQKLIYKKRRKTPKET